MSRAASARAANRTGPRIDEACRDSSPTPPCPKRPWGRTARTRQEQQVARQDLILRIDVRADLLGHAQAMPPTNVPHSEPIPPITTASKANSRFMPPDVGRELGHHAVGDTGQRHRGEGDRGRDAEDVP